MPQESSMFFLQEISGLEEIIEEKQLTSLESSTKEEE
jgi:hypothetical protein